MKINKLKFEDFLINQIIAYLEKMKSNEIFFKPLNTLVHSFLLIIILLNCNLSLAQNNAEYLKNINSIDEAKIFILYTPNVQAEIIEYWSGCDSCKYTMNTLTAIRDSIITFDSLNSKVLDFRENYFYKSSYIFFDGRELSINQIDSLRRLVISEYKNGIGFKTLFFQYNMSTRESEIMDWINGNMLLDEFEIALNDHNLGEIFFVDVPEDKFYYVVLKTHNVQIVTILSIIKFN